MDMFESSYSNSRRTSGPEAPYYSRRANTSPGRYNGRIRRLRNGARDTVEGDSSLLQSNVSVKTLVQVVIGMLSIGVWMCVVTGFGVYFVLKEKLDKNTADENVSVPELKIGLDRLKSEVNSNFQSNEARLNLMESEVRNNISHMGKMLTENNETSVEMLRQAKNEFTEKSEMTNDKLVEVETELTNLNNATNAKLEQVKNEFKQILTENNETSHEMLGQAKSELTEKSKMTNDKLVEVESKLTNLNHTTNAKLEQLENEFEQNNSRAVAKIDKVETELESVISGLNNSSTDPLISAELNSTKAELTAVIEKIERTNQQLVQVETNLSAVNEDLTNLSAKVLTTIQAVLFRARHPSAANFSENMPLIYETVLENMGGGYDNTSGIFTAPVEGTYIFSAKICLTFKKTTRVSIVAGDVVLAAIVLTVPGLGISCTTTTGFAHVQAGEQVMVKCTFSCDDGDLAPLSDGYANSFTGVLMK